MSEPKFKSGDRAEFYSTAEGVKTDDGEHRVCQYTTQTVTIVGAADRDEADDGEWFYPVQADDGVLFSAWEGELDGYFKRTNQYVLPDGSYVPNFGKAS